MRNTLCTTPEPHLLAKIIPSLPANGTLPTRNAHLEGDSIAECKAIDLRTDSNNYTRRFVTKRERSASTKVAVGELLVVADIRSAYAG